MTNGDGIAAADNSTVPSLASLIVYSISITALALLANQIPLHFLDLNVAASRYYYLYEFDTIHQVRETDTRAGFLMFIAD